MTVNINIRKFMIHPIYSGHWDGFSLQKGKHKIQAAVSKKHLFIVNNCHTHAHMLG